MPILLNIVYCFAALCVSPILLYRRITQGKYKTGWNEKLLGKVPVRTGSADCIWFHAVSVGEVLQLRTVIAELLDRRPDCEVVVSTTTSTGHDVACRTFPNQTVCYFPLDFSWSVKNAIRRINPTAIALVELEIWPNFIRFANKAGVPVGLINGRISANSFKGYRRLKFAIQKTFASLKFAAVQNITYAERITELGMASQRITVTGSVKFDGLETDRNNAKTIELRNHFGITDAEKVFIAGSTQDPEEQFAIDTYRELKAKHDNLRLILVPRHKERFEQVARTVTENGFPLLRRTDSIFVASEAFEIKDQPPVMLLDTLGELSACWGLADIAFVGGSLTNRGGQNMIEPSAYGAVVLFGPNTRNFKDVVEMLLDSDAAQVVGDNTELTKTVDHFLSNPDAAELIGQTARQVASTQQGATSRTVDLLMEWLSPINRKQKAA